MAKILDLFDAYNQGLLPVDGGYVITNYYDENSSYTRFEIISFGNVKDFFLEEEGITFQADGLKVFILVEPASYSQKHIEPCYRDDRHKIPYRFKEVDSIKTKRQTTIMVGKEPIETYTSFTILNESNNNQSFVLYKDENIVKSFENYFKKVLWQTVNIPRKDAESAALMISQVTPKIVTAF